MKTIKITAALLLLCSLMPCISSRGADVIDDVYFFGDSTTAHLAVRGGIPRERVWSGAGNTMLFTRVLDRSVKIGGEFYTLAEAAAKFQPKILVITVGASGGAGFVGEVRFKKIYADLISGVLSASPGTRVFVQSILPLSDKSAKYYKKLTKKAVATANRWIADVCRDLGVPFIDTHSVIADENGYLPQEYQNDEYLHLTSAAYKAVLDNIRHNIADHINISTYSNN